MSDVEEGSSKSWIQDKYSCHKIIFYGNRHLGSKKSPIPPENPTLPQQTPPPPGRRGQTRYYFLSKISIEPVTDEIVEPGTDEIVEPVTDEIVVLKDEVGSLPYVRTKIWP